MSAKPRRKVELIDHYIDTLGAIEFFCKNHRNREWLNSLTVEQLRNINYTAERAHDQLNGSFKR